MAVWRCCPIIRNRNLCLHRYVCAVLQLMLHQLQQCFEYVDVNVFPCTFDLSDCLAAIVIPQQQHDLSFAFLRQWRDDSTTWNECPDVDESFRPRHTSVCELRIPVAKVRKRSTVWSAPPPPVSPDLVFVPSSALPAVAPMATTDTTPPWQVRRAAREHVK